MSGSIKGGMWTPTAHAQAQQRQLDSFYHTNGYGCYVQLMESAVTIDKHRRVALLLHVLVLHAPVLYSRQ